VIAETVDVNPSRAYAKERALIEEVKAQLARGRKCQVFAVYANKHDVIERLEGCFGTTHTGSHLACRRSHSQAGRHGTGSNCGVELMWRFAIPRSRDRAGSAGLSYDSVSRDGLFIAHVASVQPEVTAYRAEAISGG